MMEFYFYALSPDKADTQSIILTWFTTLGPYIIAIAGFMYSSWQLKKTLKNNSKENERREIYKRLNEFYGPFLQLRKKSYLLYQKFRADFKVEDPNFRTITALLGGKEFEGNNKKILEEIISIGEKCENLIQEKSGLIDDDNLRNVVLPKATSHFLILRLAYQGLLSGESEKYSDLAFPRDLDGLIEKKITSLQNELSDLNKL